MSLKGLTDKQIEALKQDILNKSKEYVKKAIEEDPEYAKSRNELVNAYNKLEVECQNIKIVPYEWNEFRVLKKSEKALIPITLDCFDHLTYKKNKRVFLRILSIPGDKTISCELLKRFRMSKHSDIRWSIGEALYNINDKNCIDEYLDIIKDEKYGDDIHPIMQLIGRLKVEKAVPILMALSEKPSHKISALNSLAAYKSPKLHNFFKGYIESEDKEIKMTAKKALKDIEKVINKEKK